MTAVARAGDPLAVVPLSRGSPDDRWGPSANYAHAVWLPVLGPASFLVWQYLARTAIHEPRAVTTREHLSAAMGLGSPHGTQSAVNRALRRLERFDLVQWAGPDLLEVRCRLPDVPAHHLARLHPDIQARHRRLADR
jgi:hypothetical protein